MRGWHEFMGRVDDVVPVPLLGLILLLLTTLVAVLWYLWPLPLPRLRAGSRRRWRWRRLWPRWRWSRLRLRWRWPRWQGLRWLRWRWPRWRWSRRRQPPPPVTTTVPEEDLPELLATEPGLTADDLAAAGRYREAVRERLREIVRELVVHEVVDIRPGWTVAELSRAAAQAYPPVAAPLQAAGDRFSRIWYALAPATAADDEAMREHAAQVRHALSARKVGAGSTGHHRSERIPA